MNPTPAMRRPCAARLLAAAILIAGLAAAAVTGRWWTSDVEAERLAAFHSDVKDIADGLSASIKQRGDVTDGARSLLAIIRPDDVGSLQAWFDPAASSGRYPGLLLIGYTLVVPAESAQAVLDGVNAAAADRYITSGEPIPDLTEYVSTLRPGKSEYCLSVASAFRRGQLAQYLDLIPAAYKNADLCETPAAEDIGRVRDGGQLTIAQYAGTDVIAFEIPVYRSAEVPSTIDGRRAAYVGTMAAVFDGRALLDREILGDGQWARLEYFDVAGERHVSLESSGAASAIGSQHSISFEADGQWVLTLRADADVAAGAAEQGWAVFALFALLAILLAAVLDGLAGGRARALRMVEEKTRELAHASLHDPLTGLPNRKLLMDCTHRMLARARRRSADCAVLFLDLDGFKEVNDTFGHPVGDSLLRSVADRLTATLRDGEMLARLGGDEFVVLVENGSQAAEAVAERCLEVLREPFELVDLAEGQLTISTSIGIAMGVRATADDLLRDADHALYRAKSIGRGCAVVFGSAMHESEHQVRRLAAEKALPARG